MKFILVLSLFAASSAFADTFSDRENALEKVNASNYVAEAQKERREFNQRYINMLSSFVAKHGGKKGVVSCETEFEPMRQWGSNPDEAVGVTVLRGRAMSIELKYVNEDLYRGSGWTTDNPRYSVEPSINDCKLETKDGLACETSETEVVPDSSAAYNLTIECIDAHLKKTSRVLGLLGSN